MCSTPTFPQHRVRSESQPQSHFLGHGSREAAEGGLGAGDALGLVRFAQNGFLSKAAPEKALAFARCAAFV